jgi:23S rRNA (uracil1939-C5)-methyltransferase
MPLACCALPRPRRSAATRRKPARAPADRDRAHAAAAAQPHCQHFGLCGGCSHLDVPIDVQVDDKLHEVEALLRPHLGGLHIASAPPRRTPLHFRTKLLYPVRPGRHGAATLGIYQPLSHDIVRIRECRTQDEGLTALGVAAEQILRDLELPPWDERTQRGFVQAFGARVMAGSGELLIGVVTRPGLFERGAEVAERLLAAASELRGSGARAFKPVGVVRSINDRAGNYLLGDRNVPLRGRDYQEDRVAGLTFRVRFGSFYQVHRDADALLYRPVLELAGDVRGHRVVDGYGGVGTFGLRLARAGAARVEIVEQNPVACGDAEYNVQKNGLAGIATVAPPAPFAGAAFADTPDLLLVDPPRSGLQADGVARVLAARPRRLLCVHCSAESLARDLEGLRAGGYRVAAIRLCDLFPHTAHVEMVTLMLPN